MPGCRETREYQGHWGLSGGEPVRYSHSAVIPYRIVDGCAEVLIITSHSGDWIVPKGFLEPGMTAQGSAGKEAYEEAGVFGEVNQLMVGEYQYVKRGIDWYVAVYTMQVKEVLDDWPEKAQRRRRWVSCEEAESLVSDAELKSIILRVFEALKNPEAEDMGS